MGGSERSGSSGGHASAVSTPRIASIGRSPLIPQDASTATLSSNAPVAQPQRNGTNAEALGTFVSTLSASEPIDEAEWAAFEAEVVNAPSSSNTKVSSDGVIASAAPRTADEAALDGIEQRRGDASGTKLDDEKEEANRALEEEFEDMKELETRVKNLKARREALRYNPSSNAPFPTPTSRDLGGRGGNEARDKVDENENDGGGDDDDDDDEDEENTNDWGAFRFTI
ncbi:hypothetical protein SPI_07478 [Niveomyces insectorum RCEF 264]|uniref:Uncharacterized protein n=1 Tax=Niveomyces insectorum RCEF 264 TaxID=1081102 RepID=A0A167PWH1_9HYPO|nr:hypothetical protein SPI_07478 [Niveomyces insectorum RCEF 264]